jgi:hypothetical protein
MTGVARQHRGTPPRRGIGVEPPLPLPRFAPLGLTSRRRVLRLAMAVALLGGLVLPFQATRAQVKGKPVREGSGPVSEISTNVGAGSAPVHVRGASPRDRDPARLSGNSVRASAARDLRSGPVSEISSGPVSARRDLGRTVTVTESSTGAVKLDRAAPIGERIADPLRELGDLQEHLRNVQPLPPAESEPLP